ncbi:Pro-Pol polyprotein [Trachymyrmex cornetzi]|uniref:Pro-Pol polyprotein n=1 Tax=Trachymyrmex cornetzi TaxID=471704 RepID=A0A151JN86_9HYME|nr:Pro-Pol polyprotein [Trachymyrmex cornetzi]
MTGSPVDKRCVSKKYVFLAIDAFTKFVKLYPTKTINAKEVINCLTRYFADYSRPKIIISDRGSCFTSKEFTDFINDMNVKHIKVATGSPQANGQVERVNRVLAPALAKMVDNSDKSWHKVLLDIEFAINNTVHKSTGETPSRLFFGVVQRGANIDKLKEYLEDNVNKTNKDTDVIRETAQTRILKS